MKKSEHKRKYFNREISWLEFNLRVLEEGGQETTPILERCKFLAIASVNLDEFFMVRVAGLKRAVTENLQSTDSPDQTPPAKVLELVNHFTKNQINIIYNNHLNFTLKNLEQHHIKLMRYNELDNKPKKELTDYFYKAIFPVLTPLAVDPAHPFPFLGNGRLYLLISFVTEKKQSDLPPIAFIEIPEVLPRLIRVETKRQHDYHFILLEDLVSQHLDSLFVGFFVKDVCPIRVTRDLDFTLLENDVVDLLQSVQKEVKNREQAQAVRLEISGNLDHQIIEYLRKTLRLHVEDIYDIPGPINLKFLHKVANLPIPDLRDSPFNPRLPHQMKSNKGIFSIIKDQDFLIHHPYESFYTVIEFLNAAASDEKVLAIKQTLYRTSGDSPIIDSLIRAAENGKHVTAVVELKARFDEKNNIIWARELERSGVNVVYGFIGLKTHAKTTLVVRQEDQVINRYVHLSTGNYNSETAKSYVDLGFMTADPDIGHDISTLFNLLTGFNIFTKTAALSKWQIPEFRKIFVAPLSLREQFIYLIRTEAANSTRGHKAKIVAKMNALVDKDIIDELYRASQAGVEIRLIIRGICCLRPQMTGLSENITVSSIVDRFLEHSRIYYFYAKGNENVYLGSADWMPRNMDRRVEIMFPIDDQHCKRRIIDEILETYIADTDKARFLNAEGEYISQKGSSTIEVRSQNRFIDMARESGLKSIPYELAIRHKHRKSGTRPVFKRNSSKSLAKLKQKKERI